MTAIYLDSAIRADVEPLLATGVFAGVTTNPTILDRAGLTGADLPAVYQWSTAAGAGEFFAQAWGRDADELTASGRWLHGLGDQLVVKVAASRDGLTAAARLVEAGIPVLITAIYAVHQAVTATAIGVDWIAPYLGRMNDAGRAGRDDVVAMQWIIEASNGPTRILAASVRTVEDIEFLAGQNVAAFTLPIRLAESLFQDSATTDAVADFDAVTEKWPVSSS